MMMIRKKDFDMSFHLTFDDVYRDRVWQGVGGGASVVAGVPGIYLGHQEVGGAASGLGHHRNPSPLQQHLVVHTVTISVGIS